MNPRTIINNRRDTKSGLHASVQIITYMERDRQLALDKIKLLEQTCENLKNSNSRQERVLARLNHLCCDQCKDWVYDEDVEMCPSCGATYCNDCLLDGDHNWKLLEEGEACTNCLLTLPLI